MVKKKLKDFVRSDYLVTSGTNNFEKNKVFVLFLMLLEFTSQLEYKIDLLSSTSYRRITFSLQTFSKYVEPTCKPTNHYQLKKLLNFLTSVQSNSFATYFYSGEFSRLATIPKITSVKILEGEPFGKITQCLSFLKSYEELVIYIYCRKY